MTFQIQYLEVFENYQSNYNKREMVSVLGFAGQRQHEAMFLLVT